MNYISIVFWWLLSQQTTNRIVNQPDYQKCWLGLGCSVKNVFWPTNQSRFYDPNVWIDESTRDPSKRTSGLGTGNWWNIHWHTLTVFGRPLWGNAQNLPQLRDGKWHFATCFSRTVAAIPILSPFVGQTACIPVWSVQIRHPGRTPLIST